MQIAVKVETGFNCNWRNIEPLQPEGFKGQALALQKGYYASDRRYAKKLSSVAAQYKLQRYDK